MNDAARKRRNAAQAERRRLQRLHRYEEEARGQGFLLVGGIDEVGRGPLAGPVVAACVVTDGPLMLRGLNDSKQVTPERRAELAPQICARATAWAIGEASVAEIDRLNIYWASVLAMERALGALACQPHYLLTDAVRIKSFAGPQLPVIKGDAKCATVAAASPASLCTPASVAAAASSSAPYPATPARAAAALASASRAPLSLASASCARAKTEAMRSTLLR